MSQTQIASIPFALMMDPASVFAAMERSERLARLHSRVCRPLDKVQITKEEGEADAAADFDRAIDAAPETQF